MANQLLAFMFIKVVIMMGISSLCITGVKRRPILTRRPHPKS